MNERPVTIELPDDVVSRLERYAAARSCSIEIAARIAVENYLLTEGERVSRFAEAKRQFEQGRPRASD